MPYTKKEKELYASLVKTYGSDKAEQIYHAMLNSGKYDNIFGARSKRKRNKKQRRSYGKKKNETKRKKRKSRR